MEIMRTTFVAVFQAVVKILNLNMTLHQLTRQLIIYLVAMITAVTIKCLTVFLFFTTSHWLSSIFFIILGWWQVCVI